MLLYYHGQLSWVARSCGLPYSQREIRHCGRVAWQPSQIGPHHVTYIARWIRYGARVLLAAISDASSGHLATTL
eukprot:scaffold38042_cov211-Skeletonema_dohrnii-CCMP3373.AAC.1